MDATGCFYDEVTEKLYVANYLGHNILVCELGGGGEAEGKIVCRVTSNIHVGGMQSPENVYVKNGYVAVADYDGDRLWVLDTSGSLLWSREVKWAHGVTISDDAIFVTSLGERTLSKYDFNGNRICKIGELGYEGQDAFMWPTGLETIHGNVLVTDAHTGRLYLFDKDLNYITSLGGNGPSDNTFNFPYCANYIKGNIYVGDVFNRRIVILNRKGEIEKIWGNSIDVEKDLVLRPYNNIPYSYGISSELESDFFNPNMSGVVINGYNGFIWAEDNDYVKVEISDLKCNETIYDTNIPFLDQFYIMWAKKIEVNSKLYYVFGSSEIVNQIYVYNITDNIFYIYKSGVREAEKDIPIWQVEGEWFSEEGVDSVLSEKVVSADQYTENMLRLIEEGMDRRTAYITAFKDYYNSVYGDDLSEKMTEGQFENWIKSFFTSTPGEEFWNDYDKENRATVFMVENYYEKTKHGRTHLSEMLFVKMLCADADGSKG